MLLQNKRTLKILFLAYSSLLLLGVSDNVRGPLFPEILREFGGSDSRGSLFFAISSAMGFVGGFLSNFIIGRLGALKALRLSILLLMGGQLLMSLAPDFWFLIFGVLFFGFSLGLMGVIQNMLVVQEVPPGPLKNKVLAGLHSMYAGSSLLAPVIVTTVAWFEFPGTLWRICFWVGSGICIFILALTYGGPEISETLHQPKNRVPQAGSHAEQMYFAVALASYVLAEVLVSSRMALFMRRQFESDLTQSSWYTAAFFVCLFASRLLFTAWTPKMKVKTQLLTSLALATLSLLIGIYVHPMGLAISGFWMGPFYPLMMVQLGSLFHGSIQRAIAWGISMSSLFLVLMHVLTGLMTDLWGIQIAFLLGPGFCFLGMILIGSYEKVFRRLQHSL